MLDDDEIDRLEGIKREAAGKAFVIMVAAAVLLWALLFAAFWSLAAIIT